MNPTPQNASDVMDALAEQDVQFPTDSDIGEQDASDVLNNDNSSEDGETRVGSMVISTTGRGSTLQVPHTALEQKMESLGFPNGAIPSETPPRKAFTRAKNDLLEEYQSAVEFDGKTVEFEIWSEGRYKQYPVAEYMEDGEANTVTLGRIEFHPETNDVSYHMSDDIKGTSLADVWGAGFVVTMRERFAHHQSHHNADDIADLQRRLRSKAPHSIKLRRAVSFYPAVTDGMDEVLESYRKLYSWLNANYKLRGDSTEFFWTPLFNRDADKDFISAKLEEHLQDEIDALVDDIADSLTEDDTAEEIARDVLKPALAQMDSTVKEYEAISESTPRVRRMLRDEVKRTNGDAAERARRVLEAAKSDDTEQDTLPTESTE